MRTDTLTRAEQIARLNDRARMGLDCTALITFTRGFRAAFCGDDTPGGILAQAEALKAIRGHVFKTDAHGERDFGELEFRGRRVWFKIDCYAANLEYGSDDPADASITRRVVTIMLPEDY